MTMPDVRHLIAKSADSPVRQFGSGATRNDDSLRDDPEGFLSPLAIDRYNQYMDSVRDLAWAAGLFEGEGCITVSSIKGRTRVDGTGGDRRYHYPRLAMNLTDEDALRQFAFAVGAGKVNGPHRPRGSEKKVTWGWAVHGSTAVPVIKKLYPYLCARRRERAREVFGAALHGVGEPDSISPLAVDRYDAYMNKHRVQADGTVRDSDNWQKGMPRDTFMKGLFRHFLHAWTRHRGFLVRDPQAAEDIEEDLCAIIFNAQGYLHELLKEEYRVSD